MKRNFLRDLGVDEEHIPKIIDEHHDALSEYKDAASKAEELQSQLDTANDEIKSRDTQIQELKDSAPDNSELQKQLDDYKANNAQYEDKLKQVQLDSAIKLAVAKDANDPSDILSFIDKDGLEVTDDGEVKGLDEKLTGLKENKPYLFSAQKKTGRTPGEGDSPGKLTKDEFNKMSYDEKAEIFENKPDLFKELSN